MQNRFLTTAEKDKSSKAKVQKRNRVILKYVIKNVNVNDVIIFIVCDAKASILRKRQNPTVA